MATGCTEAGRCDEDVRSQSGYRRKFQTVNIRLRNKVSLNAMNAAVGNRLAAGRIIYLTFPNIKTISKVLLVQPPKNQIFSGLQLFERKILNCKRTLCIYLMATILDPHSFTIKPVSDKV